MQIDFAGCYSTKYLLLGADSESSSVCPSDASPEVIKNDLPLEQIEFTFDRSPTTSPSMRSISSFEPAARL